LIEFFVDTKEFAEPSATRFVQEKTGENSTRNDDAELEYLPPSWSRLKLYQQYVCTRGWDATTNNIGSIVLTPRVEEVQLRLCSWPSFFYFWKTNYPKLRVRKPIEDICSMCYIFQNTHIYAKLKQLPATAAPDSDNQKNDSNNPQNENDSEDNDNDEHAIIVGESLNDDVDNVDEEDVVDPDVLVDVNPAIIENEAKILAAAKHVVMARAQ
jgi:hypothetical protein